HAVAELRGVLDVVHTSDGVVTADQEGRVVARIAVPRRRIGRGRLTEGEAGGLQETMLNTDAAATDAIEHKAAEPTERGRTRAEHVRVGAAKVIELPVGVREGAAAWVLGGGRGINGERLSRATF